MITTAALAARLDALEAAAECDAFARRDAAVRLAELESRVAALSAELRAEREATAWADAVTVADIVAAPVRFHEPAHADRTAGRSDGANT